MVDRFLPTGPAQRRALRVGNRDQRDFLIAPIERYEILNIEAAMQGRHVRSRMSAKNGKVKIVDVEMDYVERIRFGQDLIQLHEMKRQRFAPLPGEPERLITRGNQARAGVRIAARKERHIVSLANQFFSQIRNHSFSAAI